MKKWYSLIDKVYRLENLERAYRAVRANKGAPGVDGETVEAFGQHLEERLSQLHHELKTGTYEPQPVLRVEIPKPDGSKRPLGIPTVKDRVVQQALLNILQPIFEPDFHPSSYGYRPGRSCHKAVAKAEMFMNKYGLEYVVDMDLSKCFDRLDQRMMTGEEITRKPSSTFWATPFGRGGPRTSTGKSSSTSLRQLATKRKRPCVKPFGDGVCI